MCLRSWSCLSSSFRYGVMLKKVANFFNSMDSEIIATQKPMLLDGLIAFEKTLARKNTKGKSVTWNDPVECQEYVDRLQKAAERLSFENRKLRKVHSQLGMGPNHHHVRLIHAC